MNRNSILGLVSLSALAAAVLMAGCGSGGGSALSGPLGSLGGSSNGISRRSSSVAMAPITTTHVLTWDGMGAGHGTTAVSPTDAAPWLTWAATSAKDSGAFHAAGIKTVWYTHPSHQAPGMPEYSTDESTFAHDCNGKRIFSLTYTSENVMQPSSPHLGQLWQKEIQAVTGSWGGQFDAIFSDMADYVLNATALPCNFDQTAWTASVNAMNSALGSPIIYNGLAQQGPNHTLGPEISLNATTLGGMNEGCYSATGNFPKPNRINWAGMENTEIAMAQAHKLYICSAENESDGAASVDLRTYYEASYLLTYDPATTVLRELFTTPDGFRVYPEAKLVALNPVISTPSDISGLLQSGDSTNGGIYARQYGACYIGGTFVGPCASVVNTDPSRVHPFPYPGKYANTMELSGEGILDGGTIDANGAAPPATVGKLTGMIAFGSAVSQGATPVTYVPGTATAPKAPFYTLYNSITGAISQEADVAPVGLLANEQLTYLRGFSGTFGWVTGPTQITTGQWPAANYKVTLNVTAANPQMEITQVRIVRVDANGGPKLVGLATVGSAVGLTQSLAATGPLSFTIPGTAQSANLGDRIAVVFVAKNLSTTPQSFSYDAGTGALSNLTVGP